MSVALGWIKQRVFGLAPDAATFEHMGFHRGAAATKTRLERVAQAFVHGYNLSLQEEDGVELARKLDQVELELRGFAFEGAGMGLALLDTMTPWRADRLAEFIAGPARPHMYVLHIGAGWAFARLRRRNMDSFIARMNSVFAWMALDGYGFHEGFFRAPRYIQKRMLPTHLRGYARRVFDQGLGRSMWFVNCADPERIATMIGGFESPRPADLWSGIGLACAYAGGVDRAAIESMRRAARPHWPQMAQGAAFAAKARQAAGNVAPHTELACEMLCGMSAQAAASIVDVAVAEVENGEGSRGEEQEPVYERLRRRIQIQLTSSAVSDRSARVPDAAR